MVATHIEYIYRDSISFRFISKQRKVFIILCFLSKSTLHRIQKYCSSEILTRVVMDKSSISTCRARILFCVGTTASQISWLTCCAHARSFVTAWSYFEFILTRFISKKNVYLYCCDEFISYNYFMLITATILRNSLF